MVEIIELDDWKLKKTKIIDLK